MKKDPKIWSAEWRPFYSRVRWVKGAKREQHEQSATYKVANKSSALLLIHIA